MKSLINIPGSKILSKNEQKSIKGGGSEYWCDEHSDCNGGNLCCNLKYHFCYQAAPPTQVAACKRQNPSG